MNPLRVCSLVSVARLVVILTALTAHALAEPPDLVALSVQGPDAAQIGGTVSVNTFVVNLGGPLQGSIDYDILLSQDLVIDASDVLVQSVSVGFVGAINNPVQIPASLTPGMYVWALRVATSNGEGVVFNNAIIGGQVNLFVIDLCLDSTAPLSVATVEGAPAPADHVIQVSNCGSGGAVLIFTVSTEPPVAWLDVTPGTSFAVAGGTPQAVTLKFDSGGLAPGTYTTVVRVANFNKASDVELVPVSLTVGQVTFVPGDLLLGSVAGAEVDEAWFDALKGQTLDLKVTTTFGNIKPVISIVDEGGNELIEWNLPSAAKKVKKTVKIPATGTWRLRIGTRAGTLGSYEVITDSKLPKKASMQSFKLSPTNGLMADVKVLALMGATLDLRVEPKGSFQGPVQAVLIAPSGQVVASTTQMLTTTLGGVQASGLELPELGEYLLRVSGFTSATDQVKVDVTPTQPRHEKIVLLP